MIYKNRLMPEVEPWQLLLFRTGRKGLECNAWVIVGRQTDTQRNGTKTLQKRAGGKSSALSVALALFGCGRYFFLCLLFFSVSVIAIQWLVVIEANVLHTAPRGILDVD